MLQAIRYLSEEGYGILMTSHNPDHAFLACSRTLLMRDGYVVCSGPPEETVTTETLTKLYATPVAVSPTEAFGRQFNACIPLMDSEAAPRRPWGTAYARECLPKDGRDKTPAHRDGAGRPSEKRGKNS